MEPPWGLGGARARKDGLKAGKGHFIWADGSSYEGDFLNNDIHGVGVYHWQDKREYNGQRAALAPRGDRVLASVMLGPALREATCGAASQPWGWATPSSHAVAAHRVRRFRRFSAPRPCARSRCAGLGPGASSRRKARRQARDRLLRGPTEEASGGRALGEGSPWVATPIGKPALAPPRWDRNRMMGKGAARRAPGVLGKLKPVPRGFGLMRVITSAGLGPLFRHHCAPHLGRISRLREERTSRSVGDARRRGCADLALSALAGSAAGQSERVRRDLGRGGTGRVTEGETHPEGWARETLGGSHGQVDKAAAPLTHRSLMETVGFLCYQMRISCAQMEDPIAITATTYFTMSSRDTSIETFRDIIHDHKTQDAHRPQRRLKKRRQIATAAM